MNLTFLIVVLALTAMLVLLVRAILGKEKVAEIQGKMSRSRAEPSPTPAEAPGK